MDQMDIDSVPDVPDTPDRLTAQNNKGKNRVERCSNLSMSGRVGNRNLFDAVTKTHSKVNDNRNGKYLIGAPKSAITLSDHRSSDFASGNPSSSNNPSFLLRRVTDEIPHHERKHVQPRKNEKSFYLRTSVGLDGSAVDPTESEGHVGVYKNVFPCGAPGSSRPEEYGKRSLSANKLSSSSAMANSSITSGFANKGKEPKETVSGFDRGNLVNCDKPKACKVGSTSLSSANLPRVTGQKRLVRNGCISPHNVARAKQSMVNDKDSSDVGANHTLPVASSCPHIAIGAGEDLDSHSSKGKSITSLPLSEKDTDAQNAYPPSRNSVNINEIVRDRETGDSKGDAFRSFEEPGGWRSTRNRSKKISLPFPYKNSSLPREQGEPCLINGLPSYMVERGEIGSASGTSRSNPVDIEATSSRDASLSSGEQMTSRARSQVGQINRHHPSANTLPKRQRQRLASTSHGGCSRPTMDNSDIIFLGSPENNPGISRTTETVSQNSFGSLEPVIEIDETNSEARGDGSSIVGSSSNDVSAMARQIEADEILARELQEQLYNEASSIGVSEIDAHVALALQHGDDLSPVFSRRSQAFHPRNSSTAASSRQSHSSSALSLLRRGSQARAPTLNRMARLRNRFPGRPRTISSSRERNSLFPADMDVDLRMHILETLEAINDMGVDNGLLQTQRDFNENDYEMLLALDENNHQHGGASSAQINGLPQSTVQSDNFEEACAICLETPTLGDTIRHLPCLHKFHKDCIDPWLRRRTSCPVCKSSIT